MLGDVADGYIRNDFGEVVEYTASVGMPLVMSVAYERDQVGRIKQKTEMLNGDLGSTDTFYKCDQAGRLQQVCDDEACTSIRAQYDYDLNSNRDSGFTASGTISATYDEQDRLLSYSTTSVAVTTTTTYSYSDNGELETKTVGSATTGYGYDALGNPLGPFLTIAVTLMTYVLLPTSTTIGDRRTCESPGVCMMFYVDWLVATSLMIWCVRTAARLGTSPRRWGALVVAVWFTATGGYQIATKPEGWRTDTVGSTAFGAASVLVLRAWLIWKATARRRGDENMETPR